VPRDRILSVHTAGSDRIVVAGITDGYPLYHRWLRAFRGDGQPDQTFGGGDGRVEFEDSRGEIWALVLDDGRILVVQTGDRYYQPQPHRITRLNPDGSPDTSLEAAARSSRTSIRTHCRTCCRIAKVD
jgi:hypothetical protein